MEDRWWCFTKDREGQRECVYGDDMFDEYDARGLDLAPVSDEGFETKRECQTACGIIDEREQVALSRVCSRKMGLTDKDRKLIKTFLKRKGVKLGLSYTDDDLCSAMAGYFSKEPERDTERLIYNYIQAIKQSVRDLPCTPNEDVSFRYVMNDVSLSPYHVSVSPSTYEKIVFSGHLPGIVRFSNRETGAVEYGIIVETHQSLDDIVGVSTHIANQMGAKQQDINITLCLPEFFDEENYVQISMFNQADQVVESLNQSIASGRSKLMSDLPFIQLGMKVHSDAIDPSIDLYITRIKSNGRDVYVARLPENVTREIEIDVENVDI